LFFRLLIQIWQMFLPSAAHELSKADRPLLAPGAISIMSESKKAAGAIFDDEVVDWIHHLIRERHQAASSVNIAVNAVRFLYGVTLQRDVQALMAAIPRMKRNTRRAEVYARPSRRTLQT
jgi:hypothetical protein